MGVTVQWDCNGDSLPKRESWIGDGRNLDPSNGMRVKRFNLQGFLVRPPSAFPQGRVRRFADSGAGVRMLVADLQERSKVVGPGKRSGTATLSWLSLLPIRFSEPPPGDHDPRRVANRRVWPEGDFRFGRGNTIAATRRVLGDAQAAMALPGSRPTRARELWNIIRAGRNSGQRKRKSSCGAFGDAPAEISGNGSGNLVAFRSQGRDAREYDAPDTSPDPRAAGNLNSIEWESEQEK
jgi:hypothetical protein